MRSRQGQICFCSDTQVANAIFVVDVGNAAIHVLGNCLGLSLATKTAYFLIIAAIAALKICVAFGSAGRLSLYWQARLYLILIFFIFCLY